MVGFASFLELEFLLVKCQLQQSLSVACAVEFSECMLCTEQMAYHTQDWLSLKLMHVKTAENLQNF